MTGRRWWDQVRRALADIGLLQGNGSCNGLQHYAALGRDAQGGAQVNLQPADRPQDVYSGVAALVEQERQKDAANGLQIAKVLEGHIKRKVVKQTVMTVVYGVTRFGAHLPDTEATQGPGRISPGALLGSCPLPRPEDLPLPSADVHCHARDSGLVHHLRQDDLPYHKPTSVKSPISYGDRISPEYRTIFEMHQRPNFVSVHDCYWTHPNTVDIMNKICREQFVALHSEPILEDLSKHFMRTFGYKESEMAGVNKAAELAMQNLNKVIQRIPEKGSFKLENVLDSVYFFS
ncbi:hypothetical protein MTO96_012748 [Rhipicephalus appendiculatus]